MELPGKGLARAFRSTIDCGKQISIHFLHHDDVRRNQADSHSAALVRSPAGSIDIENPDRHAADPCLKSPQAESQSPLDVAVNFLGKGYSLNSNVRSHGASHKFSSYKPSLVLRMSC